MKKLYVYADFDWLKEIELVGELGYESLRGSDSYSFSFHDEWLRRHGDLFLSEDLNNYPGMQYTQPGKDIWGFPMEITPRQGTAIWIWLISSFRIVPLWKPTCKSFTAGWPSMSASAIAMTISAITVSF